MGIALALVLHAHQPVGNFDGVIEQTYQSSYRPFLEAATARPWLRFSLHYSGFLLDWLAERHPEHLDLVRRLIAAERVEVWGGGYYEPILATIPPADQQEQMRRLAAAVERHFGLRPRGAWLAERVWEPELPRVLAHAGIEYTLLDDSHFELGGRKPDDLHGYWLTEAQGAVVRVAPSNFFLRQAIPFRPIEEAIAHLEAAAQRHPGSLLTMGDDLEKFGSWPQTSELVYGEGWLERFFDALQARAATIETVRLGDYLGHHPARGLVYLPTASYPEMNLWAASDTWRGFFTKYRESNLLHKTVWDLRRRLDACAPDAPGYAAAWTELLAAEANDVYWHGWFGGLYSPHLRTLAFSHLIAADALVEKMSPTTQPRRLDLHRDGGEVVEMRTPELRLLLAPGDGGSLEEMDYRPANANLINAIRRRAETYHEKLPATAAAPLYDPYPRAGGRLYLCPAGKTFLDFQQMTLEPEQEAAGGAYAVREAAPGRVELARGGVTKIYTLVESRMALEVSLDDDAAAGRQPVLDMVFNLLAPDAPDRWLRQAGRRYRLDWAGVLPPAPLALYDGWRQIEITLAAPEAVAWWIQPLFTLSQSEAGFETLYQGSAIAAVWRPGTAQCGVKARVETKNFL